ncbi:MAG TPA: MerR family DNA-binding transcriptional regulator [Candidatus Brevibacterium intestinigallinarum]|nr:MerR family DNA-binding transcriptional regulator [Candidatus Brevibacterium intestinigallinarum]
MMNIGEFAALTGLGVKALRHYDERGVLTPAAVDPVSGYRKYGEEQVRTGVVLKTLRDAGVPVAEAAVAAASAGASAASGAASETPNISSSAGERSAVEVLATHREAVLAARLEEDRAHERALAIAEALSRPVEIVERDRPAQPYVAVILQVPVDPATAEAQSVDDADDAVERIVLELMNALAADGIAPTGPLWITMRVAGREAVDLVCCLPVPDVLPQSWGGDDVEVGVLPPRVELCAVWSGDGADLPEGVTHPAVVALLDAYASRPEIDGMSDAREIRQTASGASAEDWTVELAVTLR